MKKFYLSILLLTFVLSISAQNQFEFLIPWPGDTSLVAESFQQDNDGDFYLLTNINKFYSDPGGIPIEGPMNFGSCVIKVEETGAVIWKNHYPTSTEVDYSLYTQGRSPTGVFQLMPNNKIILPFSTHYGILFCTETTGAFSFKKAIAEIDVMDGSILNVNLFNDDLSCTQDEIQLIKPRVDGEFTVLYEEDVSDQLFIETIGEDLELLVQDSVAQEDYFYFDYPYADSIFITALQNTINFKDLDGSLVSQLTFDPLLDLTTPQIQVALYENIIALAAAGFAPHPDISSTITLLDLNGNILGQASFVDEKIVDLDFTDDGMLLVLYDNRLNDFYSDLDLPVKVALFDQSLEHIFSKNYGLPFVRPTQIQALGDSNFAVLGTRFKSIDLINGKEKDQVYFMKNNIADLQTGIPERELSEQIGMLVFPNPADEKLHIITKTQQAATAITISSIAGQLMKSVMPKNGEHIIDTASLPAGVYILSVTYEDGQVLGQKIIIQ